MKIPFMIVAFEMHTVVKGDFYFVKDVLAGVNRSKVTVQSYLANSNVVRTFLNRKDWYY